MLTDAVRIVILVTSDNGAWATISNIHICDMSFISGGGEEVHSAHWKSCLVHLLFLGIVYKNLTFQHCQRSVKYYYIIFLINLTNTKSLTHRM